MRRTAVLTGAVKTTLSRVSVFLKKTGMNPVGTGRLVSHTKHGINIFKIRFKIKRQVLDLV